MPIAPLTPKQLASPHRIVSGGVLRLTPTTRLERSFYDESRTAEREQWWAHGVVGALLADSLRGTALIGVYLERFERALSGWNTLARWSPEQQEEWRRLWTGYTAACSARGEPLPSDLLDRAWAVMAVSDPIEASRLLDQGADPHRPPPPTARHHSTGWLRVLSWVVEADYRRRSDNKTCSTGVLRTVPILRGTWGGTWQPREREHALQTLQQLTWGSGQKGPLAPWGLEFRDRLLAEGAAPLQETAPDRSELTGPLASWWCTLKGAGDLGGRDHAETQEWGEALVAAVKGPVPAAWGLLSVLPHPRRLMDLLRQRRSTPWETAPLPKHLWHPEARISSSHHNPASAVDQVRLAMGRKDAFDMGVRATLERPLERVTSWLECWNDTANANPDPKEIAWRQEAFHAWLECSGSCTGATRYGEEAKRTEAAWGQLGQAWRALLGPAWVSSLVNVNPEATKNLPHRAWSSLLNVSSTEELSQLFQNGVPNHLDAPTAHHPKRAHWRWVGDQTLSTGALGHLLTSPSCRAAAVQFLTSTHGATWRERAWEALVCTPPAAIRPEDLPFWLEHLGTPGPENWASLFGRALMINPPLARLLVDERVRPGSLDVDTGHSLALAWGVGMGNLSHRIERAAVARWAHDESVFDAILDDLMEWGVLNGSTPGRSLLAHFAENTTEKHTELAKYPPLWVRAVERLVSAGLWDDTAHAFHDPRVEALSAHASRLRFEQEVSVSLGPAERKSRMRF